MPGKNNNDENNTCVHRSIEKCNERNDGKECNQHNILYFLKAYQKMPQMINLTTLAT